jgi:hypothetical protein
VHQGDLDGAKGVYHINAVDEVTQWQVMGCTAQIGEHWLLPVREQILEQFPFRVRGFHSDNGLNASEKFGLGARGPATRTACELSR